MLFVVASGILTLSHVNFIVGTFFGILTGYITFSLLGNDTVNESFLCLEVITHRLRFVWSFSILKDRRSLFNASCIGYTTGIDRTTIHIHGYQR